MAGNETVEISVGEIAAPIKNALVGGPFGSDLGTADYVPSGVPVIRGQNLSNGKFVGGEFVFVSEEKADRLKSNLARPGDLVFTQRGNAVLHGGQVAIVPDKPFERYLVSQSQMKLTPDQKKVESRFLYFVFTSADYRHYLRSNAVVTGVPHINLGLLREYSLSLPPIDEQKAIAGVLGALDDKIELNRRMNATLEAMARALFQSWFVDFDPVRAKLDGRTPVGMDAATAALFPATFQDTGAGHIPKGWDVKTLSDLTSLITKGTTPTQDDMTGAPGSDAQINYVRVNSIDEDGSVLADKLTTIPESVHERVLKRSILMANDVLYTIAGTIGRIALAENWLLPANTNQAVAIIRPEPEIPSGFLMLTMRHSAFREELHNNIVHAVQANLSLGMLSKARVVIPPLSILQQLFRPIDALLSQISANRAQSRTLATLRDTLLPKLLSGELSVGDLNPKEASTV